MTDPAPAPAPAPSPVPRRDRWSRQVVGPFTLRHLVVLAGSLAVVAALLAVLTTPLSSPAATPPPVPGASFVVVGEVTDGLAVGQRAPELTALRDGQPVVLADLDGNPVSLEALRGHPVWVSFWASWCPPCQEETPVLRAIDETYRDEGLRMVAVSVQETSVDDVRRYAETYDLQYPIAFDARSEVFKAWLGFGLPTHYFLDADGIVRERFYGPLSLPQVAPIVERLLREANAAASPSPVASPVASPVPSSSPRPTG